MTTMQVELFGQLMDAVFMELKLHQVSDYRWIFYRLFAVPSTKLIVTTRSHPTPLTEAALSALLANGLADRIESVGGAGYKVLRCLQDAAAYVYANTGCKKWDTAAPEAILIAAG